MVDRVGKHKLVQQGGRGSRREPRYQAGRRLVEIVLNCRKASAIGPSRRGRDLVPGIVNVTQGQMQLRRKILVAANQVFAPICSLSGRGYKLAKACSIGRTGLLDLVW